MIKLYHIKFVEDLQYVIRFVQNLYKIHATTKSKARIEYFKNFAFATEIIFKVMATLYLLSVFTFFPYPLYMVNVLYTLFCYRNVQSFMFIFFQIVSTILKMKWLLSFQFIYLTSMKQPSLDT